MADTVHAVLPGYIGVFESMPGGWCGVCAYEWPCPTEQDRRKEDAAHA